MTVSDAPLISAALVLDIPETALLLRCGRSTVYELLSDGELTGLKIGRRRLVTHESVVTFVARRTVATEALAAPIPTAAS